ncbi:hypothetical protein FYJ91_16280 [Sphingomonas montanisoli]|uniref:Uncharacterized protein n=1 Tax=Sphingomonas montanisoli TaxID=2606412 RepID=A0A5D9C610_9SPHN|nr:hypothetical protein FYJ91_16280 [Sphingomonas montanisoli]
MRTSEALFRHVGQLGAATMAKAMVDKLIDSRVTGADLGELIGHASNLAQRAAILTARQHKLALT